MSIPVTVHFYSRSDEEAAFSVGSYDLPAVPRIGETLVITETVRGVPNVGRFKILDVIWAVETDNIAYKNQIVLNVEPA